MSISSIVRKRAFPTPEERWDAGGAEPMTRYLEPDRAVTFPWFDVDLASEPKDISEQEFKAKRAPGNTVEQIGRVITKQFVTTDGIDRVSRLWLPYEYDGTMTSQSGTAFTTGIEGYAGKRSRLNAARIPMPDIQHDCEFSGRRYKGLLDIIRLASTLKQGQTLSIAKSAQSEMLMSQWWVENYNLPTSFATKGDSFDGMTQLALPIYAPEYGLNVPYIDPNAVVLHDPIEPRDLPKLLKWAAKEVSGTAPVAADLALHGDLLGVRDTIPFYKPNFWTGSLTGIAPALISGEAGRFPAWLPKGTMGNVGLFENDILCEVEEWKKEFESFPNLDAEVATGCLHAYLLSSKAKSKERGRSHRLHNQNLIHGDRFGDYDADYILGRKAVSQVALTLVS